MEWLTYSRESGFNIIDAVDEQSAEGLYGPIALAPVVEVDEQIIARIRELIKED